MFKKALGVTTAVVVILGLASVSHAKVSGEKIISKPIYTQTSVKTNNSSYNEYDIFESMRNNGFNHMADDWDNDTSKAMDGFMNNLTEEDYQEMIDFMRERNPQMAEIMEDIGREEMIEIYDNMGRSRGCHGNNGNYRSTRMRSFL